MSLIEKIKLLFKIQKPLGEVAKVVKDAKDEKRGWKTIAFWISLLTTLISGVGALQGLIPAHVAVLIGSGLTTLYNLLRGLEKVESTDVPGTLRTTEFWMGMLGIAQAGLIEIQAKGGVNDAWLTVSLAVIAGGMASAQSLAGSKPPFVDPKAPLAN